LGYDENRAKKPSNKMNILFGDVNMPVMYCKQGFSNPIANTLPRLHKSIVYSKTWPGLSSTH